MININDLTLGQVKEIQNLTSQQTNASSHPYEVGKQYLIRTVTMIQVGKLEKVYDKELVLSNASWIADTGRFNNCLVNYEFNDIEPFKHNAIVNRGAIVDCTEWCGELPKEVK